MVERGKKPSAVFLANAHTAVKEQLATTVTLKQFLKKRVKFTRAERKQILEQAILLLDGLYVHLPQKRSIYAVNPVQRLRLLDYHLEQTPDDELQDALEFHAEMIDIFNSLRDLHTNYLLPLPFRDVTAYLPFLIEEYFENGKPHYIVSRVAPGFQHEDFVEGVEVLHWNGIPIQRAVWLNAARQAGSNLAARYARGLEALTIRPLVRSLPPDEEWVTISYVSAQNKPLELQHEWLVYQPEPSAAAEAAAARPHAAHALAYDLQSLAIQETRKVLFFPEVIAAQQHIAEHPRARVQASDKWLNTNMPDVFRAGSLDDGVGYVRIFVFMVDDDEAFVSEFLRLVGQLKAERLIIDVRGNGGGLVYASERLLQLLTPYWIQPEPAQFINSAHTLNLTKGFEDLSQWVESIASVVETGTSYSSSFPITPEELCNDIGQRFYGPTVLITDALCYSATDMFVAGFQDHGIGKVLGVSANTGAGGANVWEHGMFVEFLGDPFVELPKGAGMRVSLRRTLRVGKHAGIPVEDFGVRPDATHQMTRADLLNGNEDLLRAAIALVKTLPVRKLEVQQGGMKANVTLTIRTQGISRLDVYLDRRPQKTLDVSDGETEVKLKRGSEKMLEIEGYDGDDLVALYRDRVKV